MIADGAPATGESVYWTEYGIPIRNLWYMLLYAWNEVPITFPGAMEDIENAPTLDALLASVLVKLVQQRLRIGLGRNYVEEKVLLRGLRGRINFTDSVKHHTLEHGQAYCEFQQFSQNVPKNQIIRSTLMRFVQTGQFGPNSTLAEELRHSLRRLTRDLDGVDIIDLKLDLIHRQQLGRNDRDYRLMLAICELLLQRQMPTDATGVNRLPAIDRAALKLYRVYERFVANFYRLHLPGWDVIPQKHFSWHEKMPNKYLPSMAPDLFLQEKSSGRIVILDTKFTAQSLIKNLWGGEGFNSVHLYQLYAYLKTQEYVSERHRQASGILLYPVVNQGKISERVSLRDQTIRIESVDLSAPWQEIEKHLLDLMLKNDKMGVIHIDK
jgi:5-methylcytosine-specific restriction enzyme subunit McrC